MWKKLLFGPIVLTITIIVPTVLAFVLPSNPTQYYRAYLIKQERWENLKQPRLMIVGFSEFAFGIDSKMIQDSTGYNVCNFGLHAGLGADFITRDAQMKAKKGDMVVFAFPLDMTLDGTNTQPSAPFHMIDIVPETLWHLSFNNIKNLGKGIYPFLESKLRYNLGVLSGNKMIEEGYNCTNFNEYGDEYKHWSMKPKQSSVTEVHCGPLSQFNEELFNDIVSRLKEMKTRGIKVIVVPQIIERTNYQSNKHMVIYLEKRLNQTGIQYAIAPNNFMLNPDESFDGAHPNRKGTIRVSKGIIQIVNTIIK